MTTNDVGDGMSIDGCIIIRELSISVDTFECGEKFILM